MLNKMEDIKLDEGSRLKNIEKFETYFLKTWIKRNLSKDNVDLIEEFYNIGLERKNKFIVTKINKIIFLQLKKEFEENVYENLIKQKDFIKEVISNEIFNVNNNSINISLGDVLEVLRIYDEYDTIEIKKLKFAIKTIYSILLYKLTICSVDYENAILLIGGNIFGTKENGDKLIQSSKKLNTMGTNLKLKFYNALLIDGEKTIGTIVRETVKHIKNEMLNSNYDINKFKKDKKVQLIEWIHYFLYVGSENLSDDYRKQQQVYYHRRSNLGLGNIEVKSARFDIAAFIVLLLDPEKNLERIFGDYINQLNIKDEEIEKVKTNIENKEKERATIKLKIFEVIKEKLSMYNEIKKWRDDYKVVLPIHSIEAIEYIKNNTRKKTENKKQISNYYDNYFKNLIYAFKEIIEKMVEDNSYLARNKSFGKTNSQVVEAYLECPIIKNIIKEDAILIINDHNTEKEIEVIINTIYRSSMEGIKTFINEINDYEKNLNEHKKYFEKWSKNLVSHNTILKRLNEILKLKYISIEGMENVYSAFRGFKTELNNVNHDEEEKTIGILLEINNTINQNIEWCINTKRVQKKYLQDNSGSDS